MRLITCILILLNFASASEDPYFEKNKSSILRGLDENIQTGRTSDMQVTKDLRRCIEKTIDQKTIDECLSVARSARAARLKGVNQPSAKPTNK